MNLTGADSHIQQCIDESRSFIVDAGAGSGKTSSLVAALRHIVGGAIGRSLAANGQAVACITYTNVAKAQIVNRTNANSLIHVATIHEFLWMCIRDFQAPLKVALCEHNDASGKKIDPELLRAALNLVSVQYSDTGPNYLEGRIFHDDVLRLARSLFQRFEVLSKLVAARFPYIFIDEYQDTSVIVIEILMQYLLARQDGRIVLGFFGDKMQQIYADGIGELEGEYLHKLQRVEKAENFRCSRSVIRVLNHIREDIVQFAAGDNCEGDAVYVNVSPLVDGDFMVRARRFLEGVRGWNFQVGDVKELFLTHRLISRKAGYENLLEVYDKAGGFRRDHAVKGEDPAVQYVLARVEPLLDAWRHGRSGEALSLLREGGFTAKHGQSKHKVRESLNALADVANDRTVGDVVRFVRKHELMIVPSTVWGVVFGASSESVDKQYIAGLDEVRYAQMAALCRFIQSSTPYSTKHGVKGAEFEHVLVILDDKGAKWNQYSFESSPPQTHQSGRSTPLPPT